MSRHLAPPFVRTALNGGTCVEPFLGGLAADGQPAILRIMLQQGAEDDDFDEDEDADEVVDDRGDDEDVFVLKYYEAFDEGREGWVDVYEFSPVRGDPDDDDGEPAAVHRLAMLDEALALAAERYGADPARFVNQTLLEHEYYDYVVRGRR